MDCRYYRDECEGMIRGTELYVLLPRAEAALKMYIDDRVRIDQLQDTLNGYRNFDKALCLGVDYIDQNSGTTTVNGAFDLDLK